MSDKVNYEEKLHNTVVYHEFNVWRNAFMFSVILFTVLSLYLFFRLGNYNVFIANKATAHTAIILIGLSFALSGVCYFWQSFSPLIIYRKYLGITGFVYGLIHGLFSLYTYFFNSSAPQGTYTFFTTWTFFGLHVSNVVPFLFGLIALLFFAFMTAISNRYAQKKLGQLWRSLLRIGYGAFIFVMIHFSIKKYQIWTNWFSYMNGLPPLSLLVTIFGFFVIGLRIALHISLLVNPNKPIVP